MLTNPRQGQLVRLRYGPKYRSMARYHDQVGVVIIVGKGKPRNHGVMIGDEVVIVPAGNLMKAKKEE